MWTLDFILIKRPQLRIESGVREQFSIFSLTCQQEILAKKRFDTLARMRYIVMEHLWNFYT